MAGWGVLQAARATPRPPGEDMRRVRKAKWIGVAGTEKRKGTEANRPEGTMGQVHRGLYNTMRT